MTHFDIERCIGKLKEKRKAFVSEADFQIELGWIIKELYPDYKVRLEYPAPFNPDMHIDIWILTDDGIIPIELKYKTKGCRKVIDNEIYILKNHGAKDINCYAYLKDLERIETIKEKTSDFIEGYTVFITNETSYTRKPIKENCVYKDFSLEEGIIKTGTLDWSEETGEGTKKGCEKPITIKGKYIMNWKEYSVVDDTNTGTFVYLINRVKK